MKKIGLYGGTFNPIHFGHLNLAIELTEKGGLDEVWWIPTACSPLRSTENLADPRMRYEMVRIAIEEIPQFNVLDIEIDLPPPAYTIDTVKKMLNTHPDKQFFLLLGEDALQHFMSWKEPVELIGQILLLVGGRNTASLPPFPEEVSKAVEKGRIKTSLFDISATEIRERIKKRLYSGHLLPAKVLDFISVNQLYFTV